MAIRLSLRLRNAAAAGAPRAAVILALLTAHAGVATAQDSRPPRRAAAPEFPQEVVDVFFEDARTQLVGERPSKPGEADNATVAARAGDAAGGGRYGPTQWSQLIDADALSTEVKRMVAGLREPLASQSRFTTTGRKAAGEQLSMLAVLFAVIAEYDGQVRWKADAAAVRSSLAEATALANGTGESAFQDVKHCYDDLKMLVSGQPLGGRSPEGAPLWSDLADRAVLMRRLEQAWQERCRPHLADARTFDRSAVEVRHEAQVAALLADIIHRENYDYWDDEEFRVQANELREAARGLAEAAAASDYDAARRAGARTANACATCHQSFRG